MSFYITNTTKEKKPDFPYEEMKDKVLGKEYELSITIVDIQKIRELNKTYRQKDTATDILSFPLSENSGEIFLCFSEARKEAPKFNRTFENFIGFLVIHGLVHLKGMDHSSTMESIEQRFRQEFAI